MFKFQAKRKYEWYAREARPVQPVQWLPPPPGWLAVRSPMYYSRHCWHSRRSLVWSAGALFCSPGLYSSLNLSCWRPTPPDLHCCGVRARRWETSENRVRFLHKSVKRIKDNLHCPFPSSLPALPSIRAPCPAAPASRSMTWTGWPH